MRFRQSAAWPENRSWDRSWGQNSFAGLLNYFTASKIKKQFCLRNKKKKNEKQCLVWGSNSRPSIHIESRDLCSVYCANEASARTHGNKYIFFFAHESTKPKNYISLLIRVPRCFFPKENTRQTLRHILALTIYVYTWGKAGSWWQK